MVDWKQRLLALAPQVEESLPALYKAIVQKAPSVEGEVVGDLVKQAGKKVLPDIETTAAERIVPLMIEDASQVAPKVAQAAEEVAPKVVSKLPGQLAGAAGLGAAAYGASKLFDDSNRQDYVTAEPPKTPKSTVNMMGAESSEIEGEPEYDPNDTIQNPIAKMQDTKSASDYLALSKGQMPTQPTEVERKPASDFEQQLEGAREQDRQRNMMMGLLKAAQMGGAALAGTKADTGFADTELADKNRETTRLKTNMDMIEENARIQEEKEKRDPASKTSKLYQDALKKLNPSLDVSALSASQVEKAFPTIAAAINRQDAIEARKEDAKQKSLDRQALLQSKKIEALDKVNEKDRQLLIKAQKDMDEQRATRGTPLGREVMRYNGGLHAKAIIDKYRGKEGDMPNVVKKELAVALATMVSPGLPHDKTIQDMDLKTFSGDVSDVISKVTGVPYGGKASGFVKFMDGMIDNQMSTAQKIIKEQQAKQLAVYKNAFHDPSSYKLLNDMYQSKEDLGVAPVGGQTDLNSTTISRQPVQASQPVTIRSKKTGTVKTLSAESAAKYLSNPDFERVQ